MTITTTKLTSITGLAAIAAGLIFIVIQFIHPPENAATATTGITAVGYLLGGLLFGVALFRGYSLWSRQRNVSTQSDIGPRNAQLDPVGTR